MKHLMLMLVLMVAFTVQAKPILAKADIGSIEMMQDDGTAIVQDAVVAEAPVEENGWLSQALNFVLGILGLTFAGLFAKGRLKLKQIAELGLKLYEYSADNNFNKAEIQDIIRRIMEILGKKVKLE